MNKEYSQEYSLLDYCNIPRPQSTSSKNNTNIDSVREVNLSKRPKNKEIQLTLFDAVDNLQ